MRPFDAEDAILFFGRDPQTDELLRRLDDTRFLAVIGLSGSGKSSLVRAGLLPALRRGYLSGAGSQWRSSVLRPGSDPLGALARALDGTLGPRDDRLRTLQSGSLGLMDASRHGRKADENVLIVVDQFEEIFRFQDTHRQRADEAAEFVELLLAASRDFEPVWRVFVVITLRSDYLGECARFRGLPEALNESQFLVPRMTREQLREAMAGPAALGGLELSRELAEELLDKTGEDPDQLPVLQHLLMRMWEKREQTAAGFRINEEHYVAVGGWDNALNEHADAVWNDLGRRGDLAKRIFQRLTEKAQAGREVRRPATVRELADVAEVSADEVKEVVQHFRREGCNFLTSPDRELTCDSVIDIIHESLIRRWKQLNQWTTEEAEWGQWYERVEDNLSFGGGLVNPALESVMQARKDAHWNKAWSDRYAKKKDDLRLVAYSDVVSFLEESEQTAEKLVTNQQIFLMTTRLLSALKDAETGQRGFLLTGREYYLDPYRQALSDVPSFLNDLEGLTKSCPEQAHCLEEMKPLVDEKFAELELTIKLRRSKGNDAALAVVLSDQGKTAMDRIRGLCQNMQAMAWPLLRDKSVSPPLGHQKL
jgi:CHASE3 domain sensor protein